MRVAALLLSLLLPLPAHAKSLQTCAPVLFDELRRPINYSTINQVVSALDGHDTETTGYILIIGMLESGLDQRARGAAGETGAFQIMPATEKWLRTKCAIKNPARDIGTHALLAHCYLTYLLQESGGDLPSAVAAYNAGPRVIVRMKKYQSIPDVTAQYVVRFTRLNERFSACRNQSAY